MFLLDRKTLCKAWRFCTKKASLIATAAKNGSFFAFDSRIFNEKAIKLTLRSAIKYFMHILQIYSRM